jgi:predicted DNA-binding protein (UPF0251 family)
MIIYLVSYEERNVITGGIEEHVAMAFSDEELAEEYCRRFNEDPATSPTSADVREVALCTSMPVPRPYRPKAARPGTPMKLTAAAVIAIRERYAHGASPKVLADEYGVSRQTIHNVLSGATWRWL